MFWKEFFVNLKRNFVAISAVAVGVRNSAIVTSCRRAISSDDMDIDTRLKDRPLFAVVGCTGTGKTKLGVRLAKELNGEVVSADSIQVSFFLCQFNFCPSLSTGTYLVCECCSLLFSDS